MKPSHPTCRDPRPLSLADLLVMSAALQETQAGAYLHAAPDNRHVGPTRCVVPDIDHPLTASCDPGRFPDEAPVGTGSTPSPDLPDPDPTDLLEDRSSAVSRVVVGVGAFLLVLLLALLTLAAGFLRWLR